MGTYTITVAILAPFLPLQKHVDLLVFVSSRFTAVLILSHKPCNHAQQQCVLPRTKKVCLYMFDREYVYMDFQLQCQACICLASLVKAVLVLMLCLSMQQS